MALYAFDGTWNADEADEAKETNVLKFCKCLPLDMRVFYLEGVGTRGGYIGKLLGGAMGAGVAMLRKSWRDVLSCACVTYKMVAAPGRPGSICFDFFFQRIDRRVVSSSATWLSSWPCFQRADDLDQPGCIKLAPLPCLLDQP